MSRPPTPTSPDGDGEEAERDDPDASLGHPESVLPSAPDSCQKTLGRELVRRHDMRIHIERHARPRMTGTFREFACRNTRLMPYGNSPVPQIVRMKVRHASRLTGSGHRLIGETLP